MFLKGPDPAYHAFTIEIRTPFPVLNNVFIAFQNDLSQFFAYSPAPWRKFGEGFVYEIGGVGDVFYLRHFANFV